MNPVTWSVAFRKPTGPWFRRVANLELTWHQARELAGRITAADASLQVWYTTSTAWDVANPDNEDACNILTDANKRIKIRETGVLPAGVLVPTAEEGLLLEAEWHINAS